MPHVSKAFLRDYAVWCAKAEYDRYGLPLRSAPVEVRCRWEEGLRETRQPDGTTIIYDAWAAVDREMEVGDTLVPGRLLNYLGTGSSNEDEEEVVYEVRVVEEVPGIKYRQRRHEVYLQRRMASQPLTD